MRFSRRQFVYSVVGLPFLGQQLAAQTALPTDLQPHRSPSYDSWVQRFRASALRNGISARTYDGAFRNAGFLPGVVQRDGNQFHTRRTFEKYLSIATSDDRVAKGRAAFARHQRTLGAISDAYDVPPTIVAAIWGMESTYGEQRGNIPIISSTSTLVFYGRRGAFFEKQLLAALAILERGDVTPDRLTGSWAGAMGDTQFIPTTFAAYAVDFTGDGRRDVWGDDPTDALASTAAYLARSGWRRGETWGGIVGQGAPAGDVIRPQAGGPRFSVTRNFRVIKRYNNNDSYALAVGLFADRIGGGGPIAAAFPPDANGLTRADRIALQQGLARRGYDIGTIDGVIGPKTEAAIRGFEASQGLAATGQATSGVLARLR